MGNSTEENRQQIINYVKRYILRNEMEEGDKLPSENTLATQFHVNRNVVRSALARLRAQGLIYSEQGRGFFISAKQKPIIFEHENGMGFSEILNQGNRIYKSQIIKYTTLTAGPAECKIFDIEEGALLHSLKVLRLIDDQPFAICHSILPAYLLPDFD